MARGINKVILVGNLGADPVVRYTQPPESIAIANLNLATSRSWKNKNGQQEEKTEWHRIVLYRGLAEIASKYLKKGSKVYIEGSLQTRKWQDANGADRYTTEIIADEMQMLDSRNSRDFPAMDDDTQASSGSFSNNSNLNKNASPAYETEGAATQGANEFDDDIPF